MPGSRRSIHELAGLLRSADMSALEVFEKLQSTQAAEVREALQPLDEAMASLDFDQALVHCLVLKKRFEA